MWKEFTELAAVVVAAISTVIAAYSAIQSKKAVKISLDGMAAQFLHGQSEKYASDKMKDSIRLLIKFYIDHRDCDNFVREFLSIQKNEPKYEEARRMVKFFFIENHNLVKLNIFNTEHLMLLAKDHNVCLLLHIIKPIELELGLKLKNNDDIEMYSFYEKMFPRASKDIIGFDPQYKNKL